MTSLILPVYDSASSNEGESALSTVIVPLRVRKRSISPNWKESH